MVEFLTTQGASYHLENIIKNARTQLVLISPYLKLSQSLLERLLDADRKGIKITLLYGKDELASEEKQKLQRLKNLALFFHENLHAKCFFNDEHMVITSMNMYESSQTRNWEMGVLINREDDAKVFDEAVKEAKTIVAAAKKIDLKKFEDTGEIREITRQGYCIRCGKNIMLDFKKPYCRTCYSEWSIWENPYYEEDFCHTCGKDAITSMAKPLCSSCYHRISD